MKLKNKFELLLSEFRSHMGEFVFFEVILLVIITAWISVISIARQVPDELNEYASDGRMMSFGVLVTDVSQLESLEKLNARVAGCSADLGDFPELGVYHTEAPEGLWDGVTEYLIRDGDGWAANEVNKRLIEGGMPFTAEDGRSDYIWISDVLAELNGLKPGDVIELDRPWKNSERAKDFPTSCRVRGVYRTDEEFRNAYVVPYRVAVALSGGQEYFVYLSAKSVLGYWSETNRLEALGIEVVLYNEDEMKGYVFVIFAMLVTAALVTALFVVILALLVKMNALRRRRFLALLRVEGASGNGIFEFVSIQFFMLTTVAFLVSLLISPLIVRYLRNTIVDVFGASKMKISPLSLWTGLAYILLIAIVMIVVRVAIRSVRRREIIQLLKAEK